MSGDKRQGSFENRAVWFGAVLTVLVIAVHSVNLHMLEGGSQAFGAAFSVLSYIERFFGEELGQIAVPGFFFMSGYLFSRGLSGRRITVTDIKGKWGRRLFSLVIPYLLWNLIYYVIYLAFGEAELSAGALFDALINHSCDSVFWYMKELIILSVLAPFLYAVFCDGKAKSALFITAMIFIVASNYQTLTFHAVNEDALFYYSCGMVGALFFDDVLESEGEDIHRNMTLVCLLLFIGAEGLRLIPPFSTSEAFFTGAVILQRIAGVLGLWAFMVWQRIGGEEPRPWMRTAFFIYATHYGIIRAVSLFLPENVPALLLSFLLMPAICISLAYGASVVMRRFLPGVYRILSGGR